jgi:hypothetical protein
VLLEHIVVDFAVTRTRFARVELRAGEVSLDLVCKGYRAETFPQTVMPNDSVLRVLFTGDMPHIAQVHWVSTQPNLIPTVLPSRPAAHRTAGEEADLLDDAVPVRSTRLPRSNYGVRRYAKTTPPDASSRLWTS